jgi:zinc transport system substrate-binding protein
MRYTISFTLASLLGSAAVADVPAVVTDIPPVHSLVAQVMGDLGSPVLLLDRGADPHSFQLRPSQAAEVAGAGLVVWIGPEMTPWLDRAVDGLSAEVPRLTLLTSAETEVLAYGEAGEHDHDAEGEAHAHDAAAESEDHDHDAATGEEEAHDHAAGEEEHHHSGSDPHAWLDPHNAEAWLGLIAAELGRIDPGNAAVYAGNAEAARARLEAMNADLEAQLAPLQGRPFVVFHDAYNYFTGHYGLTVAGTIALGDAASPGAARLAELRAGMEAGTALCIFPEAAHDPKQVGLMAEGTDVRIGGALEPEGSTLEPGPGLYEALMRGLGMTLAECLGQGA